MYLLKTLFWLFCSEFQSKRAKFLDFSVVAIHGDEVQSYYILICITVLPAVRSISVATHGSRIVGGNYSLICTVARTDSFNSINITYQWFNESSESWALVQNQTNLTFNPLQLHHAGQYTCVVTLSGFPNLNGNLSQSVSHNISVQSKLATLVCRKRHPPKINIVCLVI